MDNRTTEEKAKAQRIKDMWIARHRNAMVYPRTLHEKGIVQIIKGLRDYAKASNELGYKMGEDYVLGVEFHKIVSGLHGLLNGNTDRLDCGSIESLLVQLLRDEDFATNWNDETLDNYPIGTVDNYGIRE